MRRLSQNQAALACQSRLWGAHMNKQFSDREVYWSNRSMSRLGQDLSGERVLTLIIDSMDHAKWALPRSGYLAAKQFNSLQRPHMDCTAVICHGHSVTVAFAEPHIVKGSDFTCELILYVLDQLTRAGLDLREYHINIQADNCSKECKNNGVVRLVSFLCSRRSIRSARLLFCVSGHSHEDVDQFFSLLGSFLQTQSELHDPPQFMNALKSYLGNRAVRPDEPMRDVVKIDRFRDWMPGLFQMFVLVDFHHKMFCLNFVC